MNIGIPLINTCKFLPRKLLLNSTSRNYAFKSDLKIKWIRPQKIPCFKPEKSGDLQPMPSIDQSQYQLEFRHCKELETADELVKKLFTLEFGPWSKTLQVYLNEMVNGVHRHPLDAGSIEAKIARWTGVIRAFQEMMEQYPRNRRLKVQLKELIEKRKKHLKYLRKWDYKKFEWLIQNLDIVYKPPPMEFRQVERKDSLRKLTNTYCDNVVKERMVGFKLKLQEEQPAFLREKIRILEFIRIEQKECGVDVTVQLEEIDKVKKQLESILREKEEPIKEE